MFTEFTLLSISDYSQTYIYCNSTNILLYMSICVASRIVSNDNNITHCSCKLIGVCASESIFNVYFWDFVSF